MKSDYEYLMSLSSGEPYFLMYHNYILDKAKLDRDLEENELLGLIDDVTIKWSRENPLPTNPNFAVSYIAKKQSLNLTRIPFDQILHSRVMASEFYTFSNKSPKRYFKCGSESRSLWLASLVKDISSAEEGSPEWYSRANLFESLFRVMALRGVIGISDPRFEIFCKVAKLVYDKQKVRLLEQRIPFEEEKSEVFIRSEYEKLLTLFYDYRLFLIKHPADAIMTKSEMVEELTQLKSVKSVKNIFLVSLYSDIAMNESLKPTEKAIYTLSLFEGLRKYEVTMDRMYVVTDEYLDLADSLARSIHATFSNNTLLSYFWIPSLEDYQRNKELMLPEIQEYNLEALLEKLRTFKDAGIITPEMEREWSETLRSD